MRKRFMTSIRSRAVTITKQVLVGAGVLAATQSCSTLQNAQADKFDPDAPKTEKTVTPSTSKDKPGDGKTISWLDAVSGKDAAEAAARVVRQDLAGLGGVQILKNADSTVTVLGLPKHLTLADGLTAQGGWDKETKVVITAGRREVHNVDPQPAATMTLDSAAFASKGEVRFAMPAANASGRLPDVVTLTLKKADGTAYTLPIATQKADTLNVPDPLGARVMLKKKNPVFSLDSLRVSDIAQGQVGSCYFLSAIGSTVIRDQSLKTRTIAVDDHRMWVKFDRTTTESTWVLSDFDQNQGAKALRLPSAAGSKDSLDVMWPVVMEKAWMTFAKSHDYRQENGGWIVTSLRALGIPATGLPLNSLTDTALFAAIANNEVYVATTMQTIPAARKAAFSERDIVGRHAYTVLGGDADKGTIDLYNPWGSKVTVTLAEFREVFDSVGKTFPTPTPPAQPATPLAPRGG